MSALLEDNIVKTIEMRISSLKYIQKLLTGKGFYMGTVLVPKSQLAQIYSPLQTRSRSESYFYFGLSVGKLLRISDSIEFTRLIDVLLGQVESEQASKKQPSFFSKSSEEGFVDSRSSLLETGSLVPI